MIITSLGIFSMLFCVGVTARQAFRQSIHGGQSMRESLMEAWTNITIGFSINYTANLFFLPMVGAVAASGFTMASNFWLGWIYTAISFVRQMLVRRYYNWRTVKKC